MGFSVARTVNIGDNAWASPSIVTCRSSMASNSAACVFGGVRFISSARSMSVKTGPWRKLKAEVATLKTLVPVMSEGIRSGVNWMRPKLALMKIGEHTSELQSLAYLVCRLLLEKKKKTQIY